MSAPIIARRKYRCTGCGHEVILTTNHEGPCYPECSNPIPRCRQIINPHTAREIVLRVQTEHVFIGKPGEVES